MRTLLLAIVAGAALYLLMIGILVLSGRRLAAKELAGLVPNLVRLFRDLLKDRRVPRGAKIWLALAVVWIASPIDLIPEFVPLLGPLDDAVVAALVVRHLVHRAGVEVVTEHWRGEPRTLQRILSAGGIAPST